MNIDVLHNGTMLQGNFYENVGTIKDHFTIDKSTNNHKQTDSYPSSYSSPSSGTRLKDGYDGHF